MKHCYEQDNSWSIQKNKVTPGRNDAASSSEQDRHALIQLFFFLKRQEI